MHSIPYRMPLSVQRKSRLHWKALRFHKIVACLLAQLRFRWPARDAIPRITIYTEIPDVLAPRRGYDRVAAGAAAARP